MVVVVFIHLPAKYFSLISGSWNPIWTPQCRLATQQRRVDKKEREKKREVLQQQPCHCPPVFSGREWLVSISFGSNHGRDRMFGFREQAVSLYCQSKHLQLQITTSFCCLQSALCQNQMQRCTSQWQKRTMPLSRICQQCYSAEDFSSIFAKQ